MISIPSHPNSIACDVEPYVVVLARRVRWARHYPGRRLAQQYLAEARAYLTSRTITVPRELSPRYYK